MFIYFFSIIKVTHKIILYIVTILQFFSKYEKRGMCHEGVLNLLVIVLLVPAEYFHQEYRLS